MMNAAILRALRTWLENKDDDPWDCEAGNSHN